MSESTTSESEALLARIARLEAELATERAAREAAQSRVDEVAAERDRLREAYRHLQLEVELMRRRLIVAKAERVDTRQLELEFAAKLAALDALGGQLAPAPEGSASEGPTRDRASSRRPTGRRELKTLDLPEERIEIADPALEGTASRIGTEESSKLVWRRGGFVRLVIARVKYRVGATTEGAAPAIATAELPRELLVRSLAAPSLLAHLVSDKLCGGLGSSPPDRTRTSWPT